MHGFRFGGLGQSLDYTAQRPQVIDPFDFAARMWRGAGAMIAFQKLELGYQIDLTGRDLADLTAFANDPVEQKKLTEAEIPPNIRRLMRIKNL